MRTSAAANYSQRRFFFAVYRIMVEASVVFRYNDYKNQEQHTEEKRKTGR